MDSLISFLAASPLLLLFAVVGLGYLLGSVKVAGFSLGPAAVLFTGIFFGAVDSRLRLPDLLYILGLVLFVYTIGLQSGPSFFASFGPRALKANILSVSMILLAAVLSYGAFRVLRLDGLSTVGMFCGALTNTPALAASIDAIKNLLGATAEGSTRLSSGERPGHWLRRILSVRRGWSTPGVLFRLKDLDVRKAPFRIDRAARKGMGRGKNLPLSYGHSRS